MPVGNVFIRDARRDVEHDDTALAVDVVSITETSELLLACGVPDVELDLAEILSWDLVGEGNRRVVGGRCLPSRSREDGPRRREWHGTFSRTLRSSGA